MRPTAKWVAQRMRMKNFSWARLHEPIQRCVGTYFCGMSSTIDGSPVLAAAAYNAGPTRARLWRGSVPVEGRSSSRPSFRRTRDYVKKSW